MTHRKVAHPLHTVASNALPRMTCTIVKRTNISSATMRTEMCCGTSRTSSKILFPTCGPRTSMQSHHVRSERRAWELSMIPSRISLEACPTRWSALSSRVHSQLVVDVDAESAGPLVDVGLEESATSDTISASSRGSRSPVLSTLLDMLFVFRSTAVTLELRQSTLISDCFRPRFV